MLPCKDNSFSFSLCLALALYFLQHSALAWLQLRVTHSPCLALFPPPSCLLDICSVLPNSNVACLKMKPCSVPLYSKNHPSFESWGLSKGTAVFPLNRVNNEALVWSSPFPSYSCLQPNMQLVSEVVKPNKSGRLSFWPLSSDQTELDECVFFFSPLLYLNGFRQPMFPSW